MEDTKNKEERLTKLFRYMFNNQNKYRTYKKEDEEFYFADVDDTRTQFTKDQLKTINDEYGVPVSTKLTFAIVESFRAFLTGTDPYPRLIAVEANYQEWAAFWERVISSIWFENDISGELDLAVRDMLSVGGGFIHVRPNNFYRESTFNVVAEYVDYPNVFVDPASKNADLSDADFVCIARAKSISKLEKEYGITIDMGNNEINNTMDPAVPSSDIPTGFPDFGFSGSNDPDDDRKKTRFVWEKLFYELIYQSEFIGSDGTVAIEKPVLTSVPNEQKVMLGQQIQQMQQQMQAQIPQTPENPQGQQVDPMQNPTAMVEGQQAIQKAQQQIQGMANVFQQMPDYVQKYRIIDEAGRTTYVDSFAIKKEKRVKQTLQIDTKIYSEKLMPTDQIPLSHFSFSHFKNPHRTFGVVHQIKDIVKAVNKSWGLTIKDLMLRTSMRVIVPESSIQDMRKWESKFAQPGSINTYTPDPTLQDGGRPDIIDLGSVPSQIPQLIQMLVQLAEYITGIFGIMQGNQEGAPPSFGAVQTLQNFGTQRIKLIARGLERPLNRLIYNLVRYAQQYAPIDKLTLLNEGQDPTALVMGTADTKFKVRTVMTNNLPTSRQTASQMFMVLAGQVADPSVQQLLISEGLKLLDVREVDKVAEQMDAVSKMQGQMQQMQATMQEKDSQLKTMTQNMGQQQVALEVEKAKGAIKAEQAAASAQVNQSGLKKENPEATLTPASIGATQSTGVPNV